MLGFGILMAIGRLLNDEKVEQAMKSSDTNINYGIVNRIKDFDQSYRLKSSGLTRDQRAIAALYLITYQDERLSYLQEAVEEYADAFGGEEMLLKAETCYISRLATSSR